MDFGRLLGPFWEPKRHQKIDETFDVILELKKASAPHFEGRPSGMRGALGRIMEGYKDAKIAGETRTRHLELSGSV